MSTTRTYPVPVIIQDMLRKLDENQLDWVERDNVCSVIEEIERACHAEAERYRRMRGDMWEEERSRRHKRK